MNDTRPEFWFYAKRYGWGWGLPARWEGWAVLVVWLIMIGVGAAYFIQHGLTAFWIFIAVMIGVLTAICFWKGQRPRWRWGGSGDADDARKDG
ncbi:MAG: hypothetical protein GC162_04095 [Planctomycetes bacterium]|nr:hypothetical protein [Planctomycetota bacterium]